MAKGTYDPRPQAYQLARLVDLHEEGNPVGHAFRVEAIMRALIEVMPSFGVTLPEDSAVWPTAMLPHDIGKLAIPAEILRKPGALTEAEIQLVRMHPVYGERELGVLLNGYNDNPEARKFWELAMLIAGGHHERADGTGYPRGLRGDEIPLVLRFARAVDVFDAISARRSYRESMSVKETIWTMQTLVGDFDEILLSGLQRIHDAGILASVLDLTSKANLVAESND